MSSSLEDFFRENQAQVRAQMDEDADAVYPELVFCEMAMDHLFEQGMTHEAIPCHYQGRLGHSHLRVSGYGLSEDHDQLDLFISLYKGDDVLTSISDADTQLAANHCFRFFTAWAEGNIANQIDHSSDAHDLAVAIQQHHQAFEQVRIFVLTDRVAKTKQFHPKTIGATTVSLEVMDIERLYRHLVAGKPRDELVVDFAEVSGRPLPCVFVPSGEGEEYDYALAAIPGEALRFMYDRYGARLLENNVRSFLGVQSKKSVNAGIQKTLRDTPDRFMAYNNGIVMVVDELSVVQAEGGGTAIGGLKGMQIVNGGQTTASLYFTKKKHPETNLGKVNIPAKIIVIKPQNHATQAQASSQEESLLAAISLYANSQNQIKQADLSSNNHFHRQMEEWSAKVYCPDGAGRWFYERTSGSYNTWLVKDGYTPAKRKALKTACPTSRRVTKMDLARYLVAWKRQPEVACLGPQKCFHTFMSQQEDGGAEVNLGNFKEMIAKTIVFRAILSLVRKQLNGVQIPIAIYTVAVLAQQFGKRFDFERVWLQQGISPALRDHVSLWVKEVTQALDDTKGTWSLSDWVKHPECGKTLLNQRFTAPVATPEWVK